MMLSLLLPARCIECLHPAVQERLLGHLDTLEEGEQEQQGGETAACKVERVRSVAGDTVDWIDFIIFAELK